MQGFRGLTQIGASRLLAPHCNNQYINQQRRWIVATQNGARLHSQWNRLRQNDAAAMLPPLNACGARESGRRYGRFAIEPQSRAGALQMNRSEEHTSELQSLMRISYAVFCLKKKNTTKHNEHKRQPHEPNHTSD